MHLMRSVSLLKGILYRGKLLLEIICIFLYHTWNISELEVVLTNVVIHVDDAILHAIF